MFRLLLVFADFGLVTGFTSLAQADHHEEGEKADVAAPVDPATIKADEGAIEDAAEPADGAMDDAAKKVENAMEGEELPAAPEPK